MADPYIDPFETLIYGNFAREQLAEVCLGKVPKLDAMVAYAIATQKEADAAMKAVLDRQPKAAPPVDMGAVLAATRDVVVRFGAYLESLKGRPVDPKLFFRGEAPSVLARRRLTKLAAGVRHVLETAVQHKDQIRDRVTSSHATGAPRGTVLQSLLQGLQRASRRPSRPFQALRRPTRRRRRPLQGAERRPRPGEGQCKRREGLLRPRAAAPRLTAARRGLDGAILELGRRTGRGRSHDPDRVLSRRLLGRAAWRWSWRDLRFLG